MKKYIKPLVFGLTVLVILVLNEIFGWSDYLENIENLGFLTDMVKENIVEASIIYSVITIIGSVVLALPGVTFAIFAGLLFGPWLGTLLCLIASTIGAIIAFIVGRFFLQESVRPMVMKNKWLKKVLFDDAGRSDIVVLMITRLVPLFPYNLQNFAYGITNISLFSYSFYTFLFLVPGVALYTIGFAGISAEENRLLYFAIAAVLFVAVLFLGWFVKKKFLGDEKELGAVDEARKLAQPCVHCGLCTKGCKFLSKYELDLSKFAEHPELAYHCFLCGDCTAKCPKKIDGREIALVMRREAVAIKGNKIPENGYGMLIAEKKNYLFRNHKKGKCKSVLFTGCNFPSFFPQTTENLVALLKEKGVGVVYDCCGKPISELGLEKAENNALDALVRRLKADGVEELVMLCPNCYYFLKPRIDIPCVSIYDKLKELGLGVSFGGEKNNVFVPCPDKTSHTLLHSVERFANGACVVVKGVQCCGLGGCASLKEPEISQDFKTAVKEQKLDKVYTYCASCTGAMRRGGVENVYHVLTEILGTNEKPELSGKSVLNRAKLKFK